MRADDFFFFVIWRGCLRTFRAIAVKLNSSAGAWLHLLLIWHYSVQVLLLDCPLEYKKGESQTYVEITKEEEWSKLLEQEEKEVRAMCDDIIASGCNVVITEKGVSDLAQHFLVKAGISCIRRVRKTDNNRIARVTGATIVNRTEEITAEDVGTKCGLFEIKKIGEHGALARSPAENRMRVVDRA